MSSSFGNSDMYQLFADTVIHYEDTIIYTKGTHTMHIGFQGYRYRMDTFYSGNNGEAGTINCSTANTPPRPPPRNPVAAAASPKPIFCWAFPTEIQGGVNGGTWGQRSNSLAAFFQDDWRVTPNLTSIWDCAGNCTRPGRKSRIARRTSTS